MGQMKMSGALDYLAVKLVADTLGIEWNEALLRKIKFLETLQQEALNGTEPKNNNLS